MSSRVYEIVTEKILAVLESGTALAASQGQKAADDILNHS